MMTDHYLSYIFYQVTLQGFDPLVTKHLGNTTHLIAIGGSYDTQTLNW